ncbi:hypothetical protein KY386_00585 [Candidatus Parcubacteria bacterium]|nr:hypothetical protein [Candidatus Parcubacteria bacterium]
MRLAVLILVVLLSVWLQASFFGAMRPLGVVPNLLLVVVIYAGLVGTATESVAMALAGGMVLDLASGVDFGLRMAFYSLLALIIVMLKRAGANFDNVGLVLLSTVGGTLLYNAAVIVSLILSGVSLPLEAAAARVGFEVGLNLLLVLLGGRALIWLLSRGSGSRELGVKP